MAQFTQARPGALVTDQSWAVVAGTESRARRPSSVISSQPVGCLAGLESTLGHCLNDLQPIYFMHRHRDRSSRVHRRRSLWGVGDQPTGQNTTFLFSGNATSEFGTYIKSGDNSRYVK
ncbi:hypothetical protein [Burkholderia seminalis]|uniref:hypothetical protein n=1 Tax=Burkholderia seminalis TaxID=488731 RepID=UPI00158CC385